MPSLDDVVKKEDISRNEDPASVDTSKELQCQLPSSDDVVKKEDIRTDEILASVDASKEQQGQLLIYVLYSVFKKLSKCAN